MKAHIENVPRKKKEKDHTSCKDGSKISFQPGTVCILTGMQLLQNTWCLNLFHKNQTGVPFVSHTNLTLQAFYDTVTLNLNCLKLERLIGAEKSLMLLVRIFIPTDATCCKLAQSRHKENWCLGRRFFMVGGSTAGFVFQPI